MGQPTISDRWREQQNDLYSFLQLTPEFPTESYKIGESSEYVSGALFGMTCPALPIVWKVDPVKAFAGCGEKKAPKYDHPELWHNGSSVTKYRNGPDKSHHQLYVSKIETIGNGDEEADLSFRRIVGNLYAYATEEAVPDYSPIRPVSTSCFMNSCVARWARRFATLSPQNPRSKDEFNFVGPKDSDVPAVSWAIIPGPYHRPGDDEACRQEFGGHWQKVSYENSPSQLPGRHIADLNDLGIREGDALTLRVGESDGWLFGMQALIQSSITYSENIGTVVLMHDLKEEGHVYKKVLDKSGNVISSDFPTDRIFAYGGSELSLIKVEFVFK